MGLRNNPAYRQRRFGEEVRRVRERAGLGVAEAAALMGMKPPHVSNVEAGRTSLSEERLRTLAQAVGGISSTYVDALVELEHGAPKGWWTEYRDKLPQSHLDFAELEAGAVKLHNYEHLFIPGLLQTREYAAAVHRDAFAPASREAQRTAVEFRMRRQLLLTGERAPKLHAIVHESALRVYYGGRSVMRDQLLRLIEVSRLPNVTIQIFPLDAEGRVAFNSAFAVIEPAVSELGTLYRELLDESGYDGNAEVITSYRDTFAKLSGLALPPIDPESPPESHRSKDSLGLVQHILYTLL